MASYNHTFELGTIVSHTEVVVPLEHTIKKVHKYVWKLYTVQICKILKSTKNKCFLTPIFKGHAYKWYD